MRVPPNVKRLAQSISLVLLAATTVSAQGDLRLGTASFPLPDDLRDEALLQLNDGTVVRLVNLIGTDSFRLDRYGMLGELLARSHEWPIEWQFNVLYNNDRYSMATDGERVAVAWQAGRPSDNFSAVFVQVFGEDLVAHTDAVEVTGPAAGYRFGPSISVDENQVLVAFQSGPPPPENRFFTDLIAGRFDWNLEPIGPQFQVSATRDGVEDVEAQLLPNADAVFTWRQDADVEGLLGDIYLAAVDSTNTPIGVEQNLTPEEIEGAPQYPLEILSLDDQTYAVLWMSGQVLLAAQIFDANHLPISEPRKLTNEDMIPPFGLVDPRGVTTVPGGAFAVGWRGYCDIPCDPSLSTDPEDGFWDGDGTAAFVRSLSVSPEIEPVGPIRRLHEDPVGFQSLRLARASHSVFPATRWTRFVDGPENADGVWSLRPLTTVCPGPETGSEVACLGADRRFRVHARWRDFQGNEGVAAVQAQRDGWATFSFFEPSQTDLVLKILDAQTLSNSHWVFLASLSNAFFEVAVTDTLTGISRVYTNESGQFASVGDVPGLPQIDTESDELGVGLLDTHVDSSADDTEPKSGTGISTVQGLSVVATAESQGFEGVELCTPSNTRLCFFDRFAVEVAWTDFNSNSGHGQNFDIDSASQTFWFFEPTNPELTIKIVDGRSINGQFWFFFGSLTNVHFVLEVTDMVTGLQKTYENPAGTFASVGDTAPFAP